MLETNRNVAEQWFDEVWNKGRREAIAEMPSADAVLHEGGKDSVGPEGFYPYFDRLHAACSDIRTKVEQIIAQDDLVCVRWSATMRHTGGAPGHACDGKIAPDDRHHDHANRRRQARRRLAELGHARIDAADPGDRHGGSCWLSVRLKRVGVRYPD